MLFVPAVTQEGTCALLSVYLSYSDCLWTICGILFFVCSASLCMVFTILTKILFGVEVVISLQTVGPILFLNSVANQHPYNDSARTHPEIDGSLSLHLKFASDVHPVGSKLGVS